MASRLITATDTQYSGTLLASLNEQRIHGVFCDVTVIVEDKKFKAHKNILSASSTFFHQLFTRNGQVVELSFVRAEIFAEILKYVYSSKIVDVRTDLLEELIKSGQSLGVKFIADLDMPLSKKKRLAGGVKINSAEASSSGSCQKAADIEMAINVQPVLDKDTGIRPAPCYAPTVAVPIDDHKELNKPADFKSKCKDSENDDVVFCSEFVPLKRLASKNKRMRQQSVRPNKINVSNQQMSVDSISSDQELYIDEAMSPLPLNSDPPSQTNSSHITLSEPGQPQADNTASCSEPIPSKTPILDNIVSCSESELPKTSVLDNPASFSTSVPLKIPVLDHTDSCSEPQISKTCVLENTEMAQQETILDMVESSTNQMNTDSSISAETPLISSVKSPDDLLCEDVPQSQTCALPVKIDDQRQEQDDDLCSELVPQKPKVSDNSEAAELRTGLDIVKSLSPKMTVNSGISDDTPVTENVNSTSNVTLKCVTPFQTNSLSDNTSSPNQTQDEIVLSPELEPLKASISNSTEESQQGASLDTLDSASEQTINCSFSAETPLIENTKSPSEVHLKCIQSSHADSLPVDTSIPILTQGEESLSEIRSPNSGVLSNNDIDQEKTVSDSVELSTQQMTTGNIIPAQTMSNEKPKSPISIPPKCDQIPLIQNPECPIQVTLKSDEPPTTTSNISAQAPFVRKRKPSKPPLKCITPPMTGNSNLSNQTQFIQKIKSPSNTSLKCVTSPMTPYGSISPQTQFNQKMSSPSYIPSKYGTPQMTTNSEFSAQNQFVQKTRPPCSITSKYVPPFQQNTYYGNMPNYNQMQTGGSTISSSQNHMNPNTMMVNPYQSNSSCSVNSFPENHLSPINMLVQQLPSINTFVNKRMSNSNWPLNTNNFPSSHNNQTNTERVQAFYGPRLQNPQKPTFSQQTTSKSAELKIKIGNVNSGNSKDGSGVTGTGSQHIMDGKKIITLDTPSEIGGLSTGCKVYANIGEDTYDIVIPIKREPDEDEEGSSELPNSTDGSLDSKRAKLKHDDHYELNVDGKVYYICIVCKRSYVSRTSLRRHFNVHSWEKKYQCHFCEKVFALAEYRTKHEVVHTGAKRYQCLTCGETFMYHKLMSVHMKAAHSQDPQADHKLYRLHPLKSLQATQITDTSTSTSTTHPSSSTSVGNDIVLNNVDKKEVTNCEEAVPSTPSKPITWEDVFVPPAEKAAAKESQSHDSTEFDFVIPESY